MVTQHTSTVSNGNNGLPGMVGDINYVIPVEDGDPAKASLLQGFARSLMQNHQVLDLISTLPSDIFELTPEGQEIYLPRRMSGQAPVNWYGQSPRALTSFLTPVFSPFLVVFFGQDHDYEQYRNWIDAHPFPLTTVTQDGGVIPYRDFTIDALRRAFLSVCDALEGQVPDEHLYRAKTHLSQWTEPQKLELDYKVGGHNSIRPNLLALRVVGYHNTTYGPFQQINEGLEPYVEQIVSTTRTILTERNRIGERTANEFFRRPPGINLFAPAIYPHAKSLSMEGSPFGEEERKRFLMIRRLIANQTGYGFDIHSTAMTKALLGTDSEGKGNPHFLLRERAGELNLATSAVGTLAASEVSAVVRLPNAVNRTSGQVRQFAQQYRARRTTENKRLTMFKKIQSSITNAIPGAFFEFIESHHDGVRLISDAHLEWTRVRGLPLCLQKDVCRIPVTPGNLFIEQVKPKTYLHMRQADFEDILILNALKRDDPISTMFQYAIGVFAPSFADRIRVHTVEVKRRADLVESLNSFEGAMVIFDGHGQHEPSEAAVLHLQDESVNVWELRRDRLRIPPIVVLSACDTHAADRNHATTANGFLSIGARTVLGTVFPIDARDAATFVARLLFRIAEYIPAAQRLFGRSLTWMEIMSGMIRMQLLTDYCRRLLRKGLINKESYTNVHVAGNETINSFQPWPFSAVMENLLHHGVETDVAEKELLAATASSTAIGYLQLGRPETIIVHSDQQWSEELGQER